jgi:5-methyltetrahydrofolate--homocysteine methyltransferase
MSKLLIMDGAMGTMVGVNAAPEAALDVHRQYVEAGAQLLKTNSFICQDYERNVAWARLARAAGPRMVAGAMGPAIHTIYEAAHGLMDGGVDMLLAETITSIGIAMAQLEAFDKLFAASGKELPVMLSVTISRTGELLSGETLEAFWNSVREHKPYSVGINCSFGARHVGPFIEKLAGLSTVPVTCHPSAGLPNDSGGYDESPAEFAEILAGLVSRGVIQIAGGCCGTTPAHIRVLQSMTYEG